MPINLLYPTVLAGQAKPVSESISKQRLKPTFDSYILGPGDTVQVDLIGLPELSGFYTIGPDGILYMPRIRALFVEGLTVDELKYFLTQQFKVYVINPVLYVRPVAYRAVRVYVGGEITRPGYYVLSFNLTPPDKRSTSDANMISSADQGLIRSKRLASNDISEIQGIATEPYRWPTLFDALRAAQGVTPFSNLADVNVVRRQPLSSGGGKLQANINFLELVLNGNENVNIRLFDGDVITVAKSSQPMRDQLVAASRTNLSPDYIEVFVTGRVKDSGPQSLPQGSTLNQAIASAGGAKLLRGQVEFLRFSIDGSTDRRLFGYNPQAKSGDYKNPVLMTGDVVRINDSLMSASIEVLNEITGPAVGVYSIYSLFGGNRSGGN